MLKVILREILAETGLSHTQVAARSGLGRTTVADAFSTKTPVPSARTLPALARGMQLDEKDRERLMALQAATLSVCGSEDSGDA